MMDPSRLLETTRVGLERDLLRSALSEAAPEAVRARVLQSVAEVLAASACLPAGSRSNATTTDSAARSAAVPSLGTKLGLALKSLHAVHLGGAVALAAGVALVMQPWAGQDSKLRDSTRAAARSPAPGVNVVVSVPDTPALLPVLAPPASPSAPATQGALANTSAPVQHPRASEPARDSRSPAHEEEEPSDWLGAQLQLLGQARGHLESGKLDQAGELLDSYERRFPGGVISPQVRGLRTDLRERRAARSDLP